ncbi:MAG: protoglobin domain-containing protein [Polyangiales bacterium]
MNGTGEHLFDELKRYVGFNADDEARLRDLAARVVPHQDRIVDDFYAHILAHDDARRSITGGDPQVARLKKTLVHWIAGLFQGPWDEAYYERRARIGRRHVEIDLPQQYMFTAVNVIRGHLMEVVLDTAAAGAARVEIHAVNKLLDMELAVMLHTYREDHLSRMQRSERLATFGQLVASIAHELRNPLGVIESSLFLIRRRLGETQENVGKHLDKIDAQVRLSNRIINNLLDMVRERPGAPRALDLAEVIQGAVDDLGAVEGARVSVTLPADGARLQVYADPDHVRQILVNLLANALDAAGPAGRVALRVARDERGTLLRVNDDGPGIDARVRHRLFEPLVTTKTRGIGLGLALCRRLAERNGGSLALSAGELPGAAFDLRLPSTNTEHP